MQLALLSGSFTDGLRWQMPLLMLLSSLQTLV
jgi:hypothetical protein